jgi:hypothetical protein
MVQEDSALKSRHTRAFCVTAFFWVPLEVNSPSYYAWAVSEKEKMRKLRLLLLVLVLSTPSLGQRNPISEFDAESRELCHKHIATECSLRDAHRHVKKCESCVNSLSALKLHNIFFCSDRDITTFCHPKRSKLPMPSFSLLKRLYNMGASNHTNVPVAPSNNTALARPPQDTTLNPTAAPAALPAVDDENDMFKSWVQQQFEERAKVEAKQQQLIAALEHKLKAVALLRATPDACSYSFRYRFR